MKIFDNVFTSVWLASAALGYIEYKKIIPLRTPILNDFYFKQIEIQKAAQQICSKNVHNARISQWCNGDHFNNTYSYLKEHPTDKTRRLSQVNEFNNNVRPNDLEENETLSFGIDSERYSLSVNELQLWVESIYDKL